MTKTNKIINLLIIYIQKVCKITWLIKLNMNLYVMFLISNWMKQETNFFVNMNIKRNYVFFDLVN